MERLWNADYMKVWTANFLLFFAFHLIVPLLPLFLHDTFNADKHTIGVVLSGYTVTALLVRVVSGYVVDTYERRKVLLLCYGCFALMFAGYFFCSSLLLFAIVRTLHGAPFGAATVANSTMMIDVLPSSRRAEGVGYYGLSNNIALAVAPSVGLWLYDTARNFQLLFALSLAAACLGLVVDWTIGREKGRDVLHKKTFRSKNPLPLHGIGGRFLLLQGIPEAITLACLSFSFGVVSTYLAIYSRDVMKISAGTGAWFALAAIGLMASRLVGGRSLRKGLIVENAQWGMTLSMFGYLMFVALPNEIGYYGSAIIVGLGNGHMFPAMQNMFINLADNHHRGTANSTMLTAWDFGIGAGIILGGTVSEHLGYTTAFWLAFAINAIGVLTFWSYTRQHFIANRVR